MGWRRCEWGVAAGTFIPPSPRLADKEAPCPPPALHRWPRGERGRDWTEGELRSRTIFHCFSSV